MAIQLQWQVKSVILLAALDLMRMNMIHLHGMAFWDMMLHKRCAALCWKQDVALAGRLECLFGHEAF